MVKTKVDNKEVNYNLYNNLYKGDLVYSNKYINAHERYQYYLLDLLLKKVNPGDIESLLDIGCGAGIKTNQMAIYFTGARILGTDFADKGIKNANDFFSETPNLEFKKQDAMEKTMSREFDMVSAFEIAEHVEDWKAFISQIAYLTKKYMLLSFPAGRMRKYENKIGHLRNFQKGEMEAFLETLNFKPVLLYYAGFPFYSPITRAFLNLTYNSRDHESKIPLNKKVHDILFFLYRYFSFKNIGDQFIGLFKRI